MASSKKTAKTTGAPATPDTGSARAIVTAVKELPGDVLLVEGIVDGAVATATGWVSATTNHYEPKSYGADGHLKPTARPRARTRPEVLAYARRLLLEQNPGAGRDLGLADTGATEALRALSASRKTSSTKRGS